MSIVLTTPDLPAIATPAVRDRRSLPYRRLLQGLRHVLRFNAPILVLTALLLTAVAALILFAHPPLLLTVALLCFAAPAAWWWMASLCAVAWSYDLNNLHTFGWLLPLLPFPPRRWTVIHAGLDDSSAALAARFPLGRGRSLDIFDSATMTEPAIQRLRQARSTVAATTAAAASDPAPVESALAHKLPLIDDEVEAHLLILAAHELRTPAAREVFFRELHRTLRPGGVVVLVEHLRDRWGFLAFGPGFFHFLPLSEWRRLAGGQRWETLVDQPLTPFVRAVIWRKPQYAPLGAQTNANYAATRAADTANRWSSNRTGQRQPIAALHLFDGPR